MKRLNLKRRLKNVTDYRKRLALLKSGSPRFVVRKTSNNIMAQLVEYKPEGDIVHFTVDMSHIQKKGWKGHANTPAAYLIGYLMGTKAKKKFKKAVPDIGRHKPSTKLFAALKGALDAGMEIPHSEDILPDEDRIHGKHIDTFRKNAEGNQFSTYGAKYSVEKNFEKVLKEIGK